VHEANQLSSGGHPVVRCGHSTCVILLHDHRLDMTPRRSSTRGTAPLNRALSKLGILSRSRATQAIRDGRVRVDGRSVWDPLTPVPLDRSRLAVDGVTPAPAGWRAVLLHKPRGTVTTRHDPEGRRTVFDVLGDEGRGLVCVGRLDLATSGLLLLTTDTRLANWVADPVNAVPRVYVVTVRGKVDDAEVRRLTDGIVCRSERLRAAAFRLRKTSSRESHLIVELREGRNREVRRLFQAIGHKVTRLKRVRIGGLELGSLESGEHRLLMPQEVARAFPGAPIAED
jgi:23S rRNA pseudouridine2605 synthase